MKKVIFIFSIVLATLCTSLVASDFTVSSYNCGGLSDHYDYIRAVCMHKLTQERYNAEPEAMALLDKIQRVALKILFATDPKERELAENEWRSGKYAEIFDSITAHPDDTGSINKVWREKSEEIVTDYKVRPIIMNDPEVSEILHTQLKDLTRGQDIVFGRENQLNDWLDITRRVMAERIFQHQLKYDIIALQEADYLDASVFPEHYDVRFSETKHSINGVAWNKERFELVEVTGNIQGRGYAVVLRNLETGRTVAIASGHLSGCNPFRAVEGEGTLDSAKGDDDLHQIIACLDKVDADIKIIAMDANVTATHPRLSLLKEAGYTLDYSNYLEPTCTNPWQVLNTRIDWIAVKSSDHPVIPSNIPVLGIGLNSPQTNMSDHKPIAAKLSY